MCDLAYLTAQICTPERIRLVQLAMALREYPLPLRCGPVQVGWPQQRSSGRAYSVRACTNPP